MLMMIKIKNIQLCVINKHMIIKARVYTKVQANIPKVKSMLIFLFFRKLNNFAIRWVEYRDTMFCM